MKRRNALFLSEEDGMKRRNASWLCYLFFAHGQLESKRKESRPEFRWMDYDLTDACASQEFAPERL
jgi:hypothetical protein